MQNEVPPLPIVRSDGHKRSSRTLTKEFRSDSLTEKINHSQCKSIRFLQSNRKQLKPIGGPYKNNLRAHGVPESTRMSNKNSGIGQRIISAKTLRVKELQNQLTDAHYHLNELANENKLLRALQKRQDSALKRYEGTNAELPRIINSHHEELKVINMKYKQLKAQHRYTCDLLKEKENEIHSLQSQNKHLLRLSKDQHLEEREKLQMQVSDLNHQIQQQHETIQILNRKLTLESKRLKHQITTEVAKHKETKKKLQEALEKLKNAEQMLASKEKQIYNGRLPAFNRRKKITSQSLTNLQDNSFTSNFIKPSNSSKDFQYEMTKNSLPKLPGSDPDESRITIPKPNSSENSRRSETMTSLEQIRNFRLPKSGHSRRSSISGRSSHERAQELDTKLDYQSNFIAKSSRSSSLHNFNNNADTQDSEEDEEIKNITQGLAKKTIDAKYHIPNELRREAGYPFSDNDTDDEEIKEEKLITPTSRSRSLHAKLINGYISSPNTAEENVSSRLKEPKEEMKNYPSIINNKRISGLVKDNLNTDNGCDDKVADVESEEIEEEIQINNETDACNITSPKSDIVVKDTKKNNNEDVLTESKSWTVLQDKNREERKLDDLLFDFQTIDLNNKPTNSDSLSIINDNDELMQYFDKNRHTDVEDKRSDGKQSQQINLSKPVCNGDWKIEENNSNEAVDGSNECRDVKEDQEPKSRRSGRREKASNSPKQDSANGTQASDQKISNFNKQKLLAAIKAIDDNENIEYLPKKKSLESASRSQVTENLYRGLPTHAKKREDIIKDIFGPTKVETKLQSGCSKLH
ncbi:lebercilin [Chelonus insularis]|uniref:lebercilin n=1 Tax=Chelonus insularis TaxID=460826 RepID=UPI00158B873D|nr:lebercilin [Chelonus insularis]